jgi:hypothetical protein
MVVPKIPIQSFSFPRMSLTSESGVKAVRAVSNGPCFSKKQINVIGHSGSNPGQDRRFGFKP